MSCPICSTRLNFINTQVLSLRYATPKIPGVPYTYQTYLHNFKICRECRIEAVNALEFMNQEYSEFKDSYRVILTKRWIDEYVEDKQREDRESGKTFMSDETAVKLFNLKLLLPE